MVNKFNVGDLVAHKTQPNKKWVVSSIQEPTKGFFGNGLSRPLLWCERLDDKNKKISEHFYGEELTHVKD